LDKLPTSTGASRISEPSTVVKLESPQVEKAVNLYYDRGTAVPPASSAGRVPPLGVGHATKRAASATLFESWMV